jgi:uncharacterized protein
MAGYFQLKKTTSGGFMFNLKSGNHEVILTSETYNSKASAEGGIKSVQSNAPNDDRYERRTSSKNEPYFVLKGANGAVIGNSEMYSSSSAMETGIASVKMNGPSTTIKDEA